MNLIDKENPKRFTDKMASKLLVLFFLILAAFVGLCIRLFMIPRDNMEEYKKQVLSQKQYDSVTLPYKRGEILDSNGLVLAASNKVFNVILDSKVLLADKGVYLEPTLNAVRDYLHLDVAEIRSFAQNNPNSQYYVLAKGLSYDEIKEFKALQNDSKEGANIKGIWFEDEYKREYPNGSLACDVIGFTTGDTGFSYGLEAYYNDELMGTNGREYGYLNEDETFNRTTISPVDGHSIVTTIDGNIQSIVEKYLKDFNDTYKDNAHEGNGAENVGCIIMDVNSGEILAMASYPFYDLNDPRNTDALIGMRQVDEDGVKTTGEKVLSISALLGKDAEETSDENAQEEVDEDSDDQISDENEEDTITIQESLYVTEESLALMDDATLYQNLNNLWKNFCISNTYEPGSVAKPFTVAAALDSGSITGNEAYNCEGKLHVGDYDIKCHNVYGDGYLTVAESIERSCNVGLMHIAFATGKETFLDYQHSFGFGLKTNIDLAGESRTASLIYNDKTMGQTELATNSFGQGFNASMIQMISGFCSLINGGNYYQPHVVKKIVTSDGATVQNIEPRILKQTVSKSTSKKIIEYCNQVVTGEHGTGKTARPAGYMIGGKTGTAETLPRKNNQYVVSFMGYAPADDPQIAIYVVVDRPNVVFQDDAKYATRIVRNILSEVLPYLHYYMTEELTDAERKELEEKQLQDTTKVGTDQEDASLEDPGTGEAVSGDTASDNGEAGEEIGPAPEPWKDFPIDPATGYAIDPDTGAYVDPNTGVTVAGGDSTLPENSHVPVNTGDGSIGDAPD